MAGDFGPAGDERLLPHRRPGARTRTTIEAGDTTTSAPVILINETAAQRFFGKTIRSAIRSASGERHARSSASWRTSDFHGLVESAPSPCTHRLSQTPSANGGGVLLVRHQRRSGRARRIRRVDDPEVDPGLAVFGLEPLDVTLSRSVSQRRFIMMLLGAFARRALLLAGIGIHGMLSYRVARRRQEIGIRMALGAGPGTVLRLVLRDGAVLTLSGLVLGPVAAFAFTRVLRTLLFGVTATDPLTFVIVAVFFVVVATAATVVPARWASRVDPLTVLRSE